MQPNATHTTIKFHKWLKGIMWPQPVAAFKPNHPYPKQTMKFSMFISHKFTVFCFGYRILLICLIGARLAASYWKSFILITSNDHIGNGTEGGVVLSPRFKWHLKILTLNEYSRYSISIGFIYNSYYLSTQWIILFLGHHYNPSVISTVRLWMQFDSETWMK